MFLVLWTFSKWKLYILVGSSVLDWLGVSRFDGILELGVIDLLSPFDFPDVAGEEGA
jgi:hypothetical protein